MCHSFIALALMLVSVSATEVPTVKLNNGVQMPVAAFAAQVWDDDTCKSATAAALKVGFRFIWSSTLIGDSCQRAQATAVLASGISRNELFIAGTVDTSSCGSIDDCAQQTASKAEGQYSNLGEKSLDMLMLDYPAGSCDGIKGQWKAFESLYKAKRVRTIAVSNFSPSQLQCISEVAGATAPSVNQLSYAVGNAGTVVSDDGKLGVYVQAYSPLGSGSVLSNQNVVDIAKKHDKSPAQVALRWIVQTNATFATQSTNPQHLQEDISIFDFQLSDAEMAKLSQDNLLVA